MSIESGEEGAEESGMGVEEVEAAGGMAAARFEAASSFFFGRKAALMSPIPTKNSSVRAKC